MSNTTYLTSISKELRGEFFKAVRGSIAPYSMEFGVWVCDAYSSSLCGRMCSMDPFRHIYSILRVLHNVYHKLPRGGGLQQCGGVFCSGVVQCLLIWVLGM
jgi:hypothetical protein